jgi:hypothetical protein
MQMEVSNYTSKGQGALNTVLGSIGTAGALGVLNGGLGGIFGGGNCCGDNQPINRYEAQQSARIAELETEVKLRDANTYTDSKLGSLRDYVDARIGAVERELCDQRVYNATNTAAIGCIQGQVAQLMSLTKLVIPNGSICPGWGNVTVTPAAAATT